MKKIDKIACYISLVLTVFLLVLSLWFYVKDLDPTLMDQETAIAAVAGVAVIAWLISGIYLLVKLIYVQGFRDQLFLSLSKASERDERELIVSGEAARKSIVTTMAFIFIIMFASLVNVKVAKKHDEQLEKKGYVQVGLGIAKKDTFKDETVLFKYNMSEVPSFIFVVFILAIMLTSYRYHFSRLIKMDDET